MDVTSVFGYISHSMCSDMGMTKSHGLVISLHIFRHEGDKICGLHMSLHLFRYGCDKSPG